MKKLVASEKEINFINGKSVETLDSRLSMINKQLSLFKNPYVGNKRKIIPQIIKTLDKYNIEYKSVLDLFSGSAFVSMAMKMLGKVVYSNDLLSSSYIYSLAYIENPGYILSDEEKEALLEPVIVEEEPFLLTISDRFKERFTESEIKFLRNINFNITKVLCSNNDREECIYKSALAFACLQMYIIEKCFVGGRMSNNQVLAKVEHRLSHQRNCGSEMTGKGIRWIGDIYPKDPNKGKHQSYNLDAISLIEQCTDEFVKNIDLVYIDPPYGGLSSDYAEMYQFFEEYFSGGKDYRNFIDIKENGDKFVNKENYGKNFAEMIKLLNRFPCLVISYNNGGWAKIENILDIIKKHRKSVIVEEFDYDYKYRIQENRDDKAKEYLIIAR
ncbi:MAG TPA: DNA adenine methylase [Candidatus Paceibacterota bacterium]|nr:DNA adenine methylase [Candidatus Paceibacterota bacterium]